MSTVRAQPDTHRDTLVPRHVTDVALGAALSVIAQVDVWRPDLAVWGDDPVGGPAPLNSLLMLAVTFPVAWRRTAPIVATAVTMTAVAAQAILTREPPIGLLLVGPVLVLVYTVAAYGTRRQAWTGLALTAGATAVHDTLDPRIRTADDLGDASYWWLVILMAWVIGIYASSRRRSRAEAERARQLLAEREGAEREALVQERLRIAHELHDVIAHSVSVVALQAGAALELLDRTPQRARAPLLAIEGTARRTLVEMGALVGILRTAGDQEPSGAQPGLTDLPPLLERVTGAGLPVHLRVEGTPYPLPPGLDLSAYRILQEALTNALKHAGAARAVVTLCYAPRELRLTMRDDGHGEAGSTSRGHGHGLVGMRERAALYGGELQAGPHPEGGFCVTARLPTGEARA